jgi:hypothetical protein
MDFNRTDRCDFYRKLLENKVFPELPLETFDSASFSFDRIKQIGFDFPFLVKGTDENFGIELPPRSWTLKTIASFIGEDTPVRVIEVATQSEIQTLTLLQYADYLELSRTSSSQKVLNMISLEFSNTKLNDLVSPPAFVNTIDWVQRFWPIERIARNDFPRVQKYCLAGMAGSYTDFHIDFGGTSVWYHILWGMKKFLMIPPTPTNLKVYEDWSCSHDQSNIFLGDRVSDCYIVNLIPGETLIIPSGWIHAVFTPEDSLVFGGNFLHSFSITKQLQSFKIESRTKVDEIYTFPYFRQINFCVLMLFYKLLVAKKDQFDIKREISTLVVNQIPILLKNCELWTKDKGIRTSYEGFLDGKDSLETVFRNFWEYFDEQKLSLWNDLVWEDFLRASKIVDWEEKISDRVSSKQFLKLTDCDKDKGDEVTDKIFSPRRKSARKHVQELTLLAGVDPESISKDSEYEEEEENAEFAGEKEGFKSKKRSASSPPTSCKKPKDSKTTSSVTSNLAQNRKKLWKLCSK